MKELFKIYKNNLEQKFDVYQEKIKYINTINFKKNQNYPILSIIRWSGLKDIMKKMLKMKHLEIIIF